MSANYGIQWVLVMIMLNYTYSTLYSISPNLTVSTVRSYDELAHMVYIQKNYQEGWNYLYGYANIQKSLNEQHKGVGFLQGYITYKEIYQAYNNLYQSILGGEPQVNAPTQQYIDQQLDYLDRMIKAYPRDIFWQYADAYLQQLRFMYRGYLTRINEENRLDMFIGFSQFYYLTNVGDMQDIIPAFKQQSTNKKQSNEQQFHKGGNCNGYAKLLNDRIYVGHSTHNIYSFLLRIMKSYSFPTRNTDIGSQLITFSSRPADLNSKDDLYLLSSGLKVMQTSFNNYNRLNYDDLSPKTVPTWLRVCIATNLARNGTQFVDYFTRQRSGTHNNQWVIMDEAQITTGKNIIIFIEDAFSIYRVTDMSDVFRLQGYIGSYNMPFNSDVFKKLGYEAQSANYDTDLRAVIYKQYNELMINEQSMKIKLIMQREQDQPNEGLAPRYDMLKQNPSPFGLTDCKIIVPGKTYIWAISGPSTSDNKYPPFDWTKFPNTAHQGMSIVWNFTWQAVPIDIEAQVDISNNQQQLNLQVQ